ncbi:CPXCG motif-containing cysteine-rich protein [Alteromonas sp. ASW11-19]|uniref:CPXCG motif-containing cysteine-rich protein n=1 Tax=Alteromonas salexigens TaxID=2982530 RepID=A0ABT2VKD5_9ALTE|nr:CPXCG motif-containing cysteine-rich protein [Alteromonas salexigens]MCU7553479.1 CPXCG motif-containing cysteine-rich protein [Alteromonas salexigens]
MSLTRPMGFSCPYCMAPNDVEVDEVNDVNQTQVLDCQICCQPIELTVTGSGDDLQVMAEREND